MIRTNFDILLGVNCHLHTVIQMQVNCEKQKGVYKTVDIALKTMKIKLLL